MIQKKRDMKINAILAMFISLILMLLGIFALGEIRGSFLKAVTYGLMVGNAVLVFQISRHILKNDK